MPKPTQADIDYLKANPESAEKFRAPVGALPNDMAAQPAPARTQTARNSLDQLKTLYQQRQRAGAKPEELSAIADQYVAKEQEQGGFGLALDDTMRTLARGTVGSGGILDEVSARTSERFGGNYDEALDYERARNRNVDKRFPMLSTGLQVAGGVGSTLAGMRALGMGAAGVNSGVPIAQRAATGLMIGAPVGAVDAFTRGEGGLENRLYDAALGGVLGGATGAAAPLIGQGISSAYQTGKNMLTPNAWFGRIGVSKPVGEELVDYLGGDASKTGLARIRAAGPDAMLMDAGPNAIGLADAVIQKRGPGASVVADAVAQRAKKSSRNVVQTLDRTLGAPEGSVAQITAIREGSAEARDRAYRTAYDSAIDYASEQGQNIQSLFRSIPSEAWGYANKLMQVERAKSKQILFDIADDGTVELKTLPDVRQLDYVKQAIDGVADAEDGKGVFGGQTRMGRAYRKLAMDLRDSVKDAVPAYGKALESAADPASRIEGVKLGAKVLNPLFSRAELKEALDGMTRPERQAVMSGVRAQLDEMIANVRSTASDPDNAARQLDKMVRELTSDAVRKKIGLVLNDPKKTLEFFREIGQAFKSAGLRAGVAANSKTATREMAMKGIDERLQPGVIGTAMEGNLPGASKKAVQIATGATPRQQRLRNNEQWLEIGKLLTEKRGREAEQLLRKLIAAGSSRAASRATGKSLGTVGAGTVAGSNPQLVEQIN